MQPKYLDKKGSTPAKQAQQTQRILLRNNTQLPNTYRNHPVTRHTHHREDRMQGAESAGKNKIPIY